MMNEWILSSSILIAAVLAVRFALRGKISLRLQYALWAVVLVRLLLPVQIFTSGLGVGSVAQSVDISAPVRQVYASANENRYEREYDEAYRRVVAAYEASQQSYDPHMVEHEAQDIAQRSMELDLTQLLYHIWFAGMVVMTAVIVSCNIHLSLQLRRRRYEYPAADSLLPVFVTEAVPTPCIFGLFRPAVYLTPDAAKDEQVRTHVLTHELTHYRHLDHVWSVLRSVCLVLHWYNPLVWIAAKVSRADAELACDEGALKALGEEQRGDYGRTLIGLTCADHVGSVFLTATTMTGSAGSIRERIKLLMKRPRNTVLTLTAVILMVTLIVGCTFAGAPETAAPTESTPSHEGQELSIPDDPTASDFKNADGVLVFPGTRWGMTEAELIDALNIQEYGVFSGMRGIYLPDTTFCGYPASIAFYFDHYRNEDEWALCDVRVQLADEDAANAVYNILYEQLGKFDIQTSGFTSAAWHSDAELEDLISPAACAIYRESHQEYPLDGGAASTIAWFGGGDPETENVLWFSSGLALAEQIEATLDLAQTVDVEDLFVEDTGHWYLASLTTLFSDQYSFDAAAFFGTVQTDTLTKEEQALVTAAYGADALGKPIFRMTEAQMDEVLMQYLGFSVWDVDLSDFLFCPETGAYLRLCDGSKPSVPQILSSQVLTENLVRLVYSFPGDDRHYVVTLMKGENWKVYANQLLLEKPLDAQELTMDQVTMIRAGFPPHIYDEALGEGYANPLACFVHTMYEDITEMSRSDFLEYFPATAEGTEEEFELLKAKYPEFFGEWTFDTMPIPIHRFDPEDLDETMLASAGIRWEDLAQDPKLHYLEETGCYYNYSSDFGLMGFYCTGGWVYDGGAVLCSPGSALYLTERDGHYYIQAHLPAIVSER